MTQRQDPDMVTWVSLRDYFERLLTEHKSVHDSQAEANKVALSALNERLAGMNEFRRTIEDQRVTFVSREVFDNMIEEKERRIRILETDKAQRDGVLIAISVGLSVAAVVIGKLWQ